MAVTHDVRGVRRAWTVYAASLTLAVVIGEFSNLAHGEQVTARTVVNWFVTCMLLVATWAYALDKPLGTARYWRTAFWVLLYAGLVTLLPVVLAGGLQLAVAVVLMAFVVPAYVATYSYAFRSHHLWGSREPAT